MVITGLEPEDIGEALPLGHKMINNDDQNAAGSAQSASRQMHAQLYAGEGGPVDVRMIGAPRTPRSATPERPRFGVTLFMWLNAPPAVGLFQLYAKILACQSYTRRNAWYGHRLTGL